MPEMVTVAHNYEMYFQRHSGYGYLTNRSGGSGGSEGIYCPIDVHQQQNNDDNGYLVPSNISEGSDRKYYVLDEDLVDASRERMLEMGNMNQMEMRNMAKASPHLQAIEYPSSAASMVRQVPEGPQIIPHQQIASIQKPQGKVSHATLMPKRSKANEGRKYTDTI